MISRLLLSCSIVKTVGTNAAEGQDRYCRTSELKDHHILFLVGGGHAEKSSGRKYIVARMNGLQDFAEARQMPNWHFQVVPDHEH